MKKFRLFFISVLAICMAACDGCSDKGSGELAGHLKFGIERFKSAIDSETNPQILDYRTAEEFSQGHIPGAINIPADIYNTKEQNGAFMSAVQAQFETAKTVYIYGGGDSWGTLGNVVPGRIANVWGKSKTVLLDGGFQAWKDKGYPVQ